MYHRILVPLDGSPLAEVALEQLGHLAGPETEVLLLRVVEPVTDLPPFAVAPNPPSGGFAAVVPPGGRGRDEPAEGDDRALREAQQYLDGKADALRVTAVKRRALVLEDIDPAAAIAGQARDEPADLILMATHGRSGVVRTILGSVAEKVLHSTHVPLLLVRSGKSA
jgi:nucleotide-binding universal stress UspA family protein